MKLSDTLSALYTKDSYSALDAQCVAEAITWGPVLFQVARLLYKFQLLELIESTDGGLTAAECVQQSGCTPFAVELLLEAGLGAGILLIDPESERYHLSKIGWFLLKDPNKKVNMDFVHDVNYRGLYYLEEALTEGRPAGLKTLGNWSTVYEGLSQLPEKERSSWLAFDHFYSDCSFDAILPLVLGNAPKHLLDIGGNTGKFALHCVSYNPEVRVTIADLPGQLAMMTDFVAGKKGAERITGYPINLLNTTEKLPTGTWDVIWMSQFLVCFSKEQIAHILALTAEIMTAQTRLYILDLFWNLQKTEAAALSLTMTSVYFADIANGCSKFYRYEVYEELIKQAGLRIVKIHAPLPIGHNLLEIVKA